MTEHLIELSVVIPTYNRLDRLRSVIPALIAQDVRPDRYEIIVADSLSNDGTREYLAEVSKDAPHVRHLPGPYTGRASARNAGIAAARGALVLFTDADIIASPDLLSRHLARHADGFARAVVGMEIQVDSYDDYRQKRDHPALRHPLHPMTRKRLSWMFFLTGNASVPRAVLDRVGRFDEDVHRLWPRGSGAGLPACSTPACRSCTSRRRGELPLAPGAVAKNSKHEVRAGRRARRCVSTASTSAARRATAPRHDAASRSRCTTWSITESRPLQDLDRAAAHGVPGFARTLSYQYHYLTGSQGRPAWITRRSPACLAARFSHRRRRNARWK